MKFRILVRGEYFGSAGSLEYAILLSKIAVDLGAEIQEVEILPL